MSEENRMKTTDKVLIGIVAGIVLLIIVALVVTLTRPEPTYQAEDTPEGVAHNYLLALQKEEYERAYNYLSPTLEGYPTSVKKFEEHIHDNAWRFRLDTDVTLSVESSRVTGNFATVSVRESRFWGGDLFDSGQSTYTFDMDLRLEEGQWKIIDSGSYFAWCWDREDGCD
jgi:hypothetical protein